MKNKLFFLVFLNFILLSNQNLRKKDDISNLNLDFKQEIINLSNYNDETIVENFHLDSHGINLNNLNTIHKNLNKTINENKFSNNSGEMEKFVPLFLNSNYNIENNVYNFEKLLNHEENYENYENSMSKDKNDGFHKFSFYENNHLYEGGNILKGVKIKELESNGDNIGFFNKIDLSITGSKKILGYLNE